MAFLWSLVLLVLLFSPPTWSNNDVISEDLKVRTRNGMIQGVTEVAANGREVDVFWGIPFADPPLGDLRFRDPKPIKK